MKRSFFKLSPAKPFGFRMGAWTMTLLFLLGVVQLSAEPASGQGRIVIKYWEKWTGFEGDAMRALVNDFNASQNRIYVDFLTISQIDRKLMLATGGGNPPDVAGVWSWIVPVFAENNALTPLDKLAREGGIKESDYIDAYWRLCCHRGRLWALPSTPASLALHWNKKMFRQAGLDPEKPPRSMAELEEMNEKLTVRNKDGSLKIVGHLADEPGWWSINWNFWFDGSYFDGKDKITADTPENRAAFEWIQSYPKRFGAANVLRFKEGFGTFASPQNPFFTQKVAMVIQGVWMYNFIKNYAPSDFEWGVAPFPSVDPKKLKDVTIVEEDILVIPVGAKHPREAFEFIKYVNSQGPMEKLCLAQRKFTPLQKVSPEFLRNHPNPYIKTFIDLAKSPNAKTLPGLTSWKELKNDLVQAVGQVWRLLATPTEVLRYVGAHQQKAFDRKNEQWLRVQQNRVREWDRREADL